MKLYIFAFAYDDSGLEVEVHGVYKTKDEALKGMKDYFVEVCSYPEDEAMENAQELMDDHYFEELGEEFEVPAVYRLEEVTV